MFQQHVLTPALKALSAENIRLDVSLSDERPDLNRRDHDLYIHIGHLQDGDYYAQRICQTELMYVASPAFLARHPAGISPRDLRHVDVLRYSHHGVMVPWHLDGEPIAVNPDAKLVSNTGEYLAEAAIDGLGVTQLTDFMARPFIDSGRLVQMFPDHRPYWMPVYLLYFERTKQSRALKRSLAIVGQYLKDFCEAAARVEAPQRREKSTPALG